MSLFFHEASTEVNSTWKVTNNLRLVARIVLTECFTSAFEPLFSLNNSLLLFNMPHESLSMSDSFSRSSSEGWFSRIGGAIKGMLIGVIACLGSVVLLFWNEGRAVQTAQSLDEGAGAVVSVSADNVDVANESKLIHLSGEATTTDTLDDLEFNVSETAIRLRRNVEMYQWEEDEKRETKKKFGGGKETITTFTYDKVWSGSLINSDSFDKEYGADYRNPNSMPIESQTVHAENVTLGAFQMSPSLRNKVDNPSQLRLTEENIPEALATTMRVQDAQTLYLGEDPTVPKIGDCRVTFAVTKPAAVTVVSQQTENSFQPYQTQAGDPLDMLRMGKYSAEQMFDMAHADNRTLTWVLRGVGTVVMFIGLIMFTKPLSVLSDVIPILGNIAEIGLAIVAGLLTVAGACTTIGIAWLFYRPLIGVPLLVVSVGALALLFRKRKSTSTSPAEEFSLEPPA